mgnify:FL=1
MKQFSQEFKASVIERIRNGESQMGVAKSLGISCKTVNSWWTKAKQELPQEQLSAEQEIARLKKLLREREAEIDFLKKSLEPDSLSRGGQQYFPITPFLNGVAKPTLAMNSF